MKKIALALACAALAACRSTADAPPPPRLTPAPLASVPTASASTSTGAPVPSPLAWMPAPSFGAPGPIRVTGYPKKTSLGMNDPASHVGFTPDGKDLGFCDGEHYPAGPRHECELLDAAGKLRRASGADAIALKKRLVATDGAPPPLTGTWPYAADLELVIDDTAQGKDGATVRLGAKVAGEAQPVYSVFVSACSSSSASSRSSCSASSRAPRSSS